MVAQTVTSGCGLASATWPSASCSSISPSSGLTRPWEVCIAFSATCCRNMQSHSKSLNTMHNRIGEPVERCGRPHRSHAGQDLCMAKLTNAILWKGLIWQEMQCHHVDHARFGLRICAAPSMVHKEFHWQVQAAGKSSIEHSCSPCSALQQHIGKQHSMKKSYYARLPRGGGGGGGWVP